MSARRMPQVNRYIFTDTALGTLHAWFSKAGTQEVEDVAIAAGYPTADGDAFVSTVLHPDADRAPGWYEQRDGAAWDELYLFGARHTMYYLLQIHTHPPSCSTRHSPRDDSGAFSDRIGFLSIVIPDFGIDPVDLYDERVTVHERVADGWRIWPTTEVRERIAVVPSSVDLQSDRRVP